jgi:hypothetical protein
MTDLLQEYTGTCHCGAIGFTYRTVLDTPAWSIRACQCSFCRAHHALSTSDPAGNIEFSARDGDLLNRYRFGQGITDFLLCRRCGVYVGALIETSSGIFGIINVNALRPIPIDIPEPAAMEYGAESKEQRISRREQRWSPASITIDTKPN